MARWAALVAVVLALAGARLVAAVFKCDGPTFQESNFDSGQTKIIIFEQLPCADGPSTYYIGNYTIFSADAYTLQYGDQPCKAEDYDNTNFDAMEVTYNDALRHDAQFGYYPAASPYRVKAQITFTAVRGCNIDWNVCMGIYNRTTLQR